MFAATAAAVPLHIAIHDEKGTPIWTRLEVRNATGQMFQPPGAIVEHMKNARRGKPYYLGSFIVDGAADLDVPSGKYLVVAEHGTEYERVERSVRTGEKPVRVNLRVRPWIRMNRAGWWSGDMHVHRPIADAPGIAQAEDLNVTVLVNRSKAAFFSEAGWPDKSEMRVTGHNRVTLRNAEDERRGGSWIFNGLREPLKVGWETGWYPPGLDYVAQVRAQKSSDGVLPWFDIDMPFWWEVPVMVALGQPDSIDIMHNQFMQYGIDESEYWGRARDRSVYPGPFGFVRYCLDLYYRYLNLGFRIPPSAGTGSGVMPNPAGYDRLYAHISGAFDIDKWYEAIRSGQSFVTNGPMLFVKATTKESRELVDASAVAREPIDRLEFIVDGRIAGTVRARMGSKKIRARFAVSRDDHAWCAVRCFLSTPDNIRLAHSSPIWLGGKTDAREDARYFAQWIDVLIEQTLRDEKRFRSEAERLRIISIYRKARDAYRQRATAQ